MPEQFFLSSSNAGIDHYHDDFDDNSLGYYSDGTKRTLTDTQISIFRHSEIQRILRKESGELEGPIFPGTVKQKTHVHNKDRLKEKKAAQKFARAGKDARRAGVIERDEAQKTIHTPKPYEKPSLAPIEPPVIGKAQSKKRRKKKTNPATIAHNAARAWKPKSQRLPSLKRRNTSSPEPEPEPEPGRSRKRPKDNGPSTQVKDEVRHDPEEYKSEGEDFTYRRLARDEDDVPNVSVELDY